MKYLKEKYALSDEGAKDLCKGILYSVLAYISLMLPVALLACVLNDFLTSLLTEGGQRANIGMYVIIGIIILAVIFVMHYLQYTITYMGTYEESERRRITLAEKLRTLPLRFFQEHDLSDLTNTIMGDCSGFEHAFSHTVPQFWGSIISTAIVCIALLIYDWRMGLALLWVAPVAFAIVLLSRKWQAKLGQKHIDAKLELSDGIQECLETVQDIKACNQEEQYLKKLDKKMDNAEKAARCHDFIEKLPQGYQTVIGENGSTLSGGECQRLSIARTLLKDVPVILLDEATASLDVDNETEIQETISKLVKGKTVLVIAHRMRTVENADQIVVLDGGVVAEKGTHEELMKKDGLYARLVKLQTQSAEWKLKASDVDRQNKISC